MESENLFKFVGPAVAELQTSFIAPDNRDFHPYERTGSGVFLEPNLILTSAHVVARIATAYVSKPVDEMKPSPSFEQHGCICHKSCIGNTIALGDAIKTGELKTTPLAVNFRSDLAVLKVTDEEERTISRRRCAVVASKSPSVEENILFSVSCVRVLQDYTCFRYGIFRSMGDNAMRAKAPWPLDDEEVRWIELDFLDTRGFMFPVGHPHRGDCSCERKSTGSLYSVLGNMGGSPWFNLDGELVGVLSWGAKKGEFPMAYAVPYLCIKDVLDYAKSKGPEDPIVMDNWIDLDGVVD